LLMSGGLSCRYVTQCIPAFILLSMLAGCGAFSGKPAPEIVQLAAPPKPTFEMPPPTLAPEAASVPAVEPKRDAPEVKHPSSKKPSARTPHRARETPQAAPAKPAVPTPIIATRLLPPAQTHTLLDARVQRPDGKIIGRAIDMFIDANGKPHAMLVNLAGFMGVGDRKMRFPWSAFRFSSGPKIAPFTLEIAASEPSGAEAKPVPEASGAEPLTRSIIDATVERRNGTRVGRVIDVLIDNNAQPQAAVLDISSLISNSRRSIATDWRALHFVKRNNALELQIDLSDKQIDAAPPYTAGQPVHAVSSPGPAPVATASPAPRAGASPVKGRSTVPDFASTARPQR
jgi:hypothetical protein